MRNTFASILAFSMITSAAYGQAFFSEEGLKKAGGDVVRTVDDGIKKAAPVVAPGATIVLQTIQGKPLGDAVKDTALASPKIIIDGAKTAGALDQSIENAVKNAVGPDLAKVIEVVRLPEKIERSAAITAADVAVGAVDGKPTNAATIAAVPLAGAIQQAIDLYTARAQPIPPTMKELLSTVHSAETLSSARFVVDDNLGSLPGTINFLREKSANNFAVTVGQTIVFAKDPGLADVHFWAHELQHTAQYRELGVPGFAGKYLEKSGEMEAEAERYGKKAEEEAPVILSFLRTKQQAVK